MLIVKTFKPEYLDEFISSFDFYLQETGGNSISYSLLPIGAVQLLFQFETQVGHNTIFTKGWQHRPDVFIAGPYDKGYEMKLAPFAKIFSVTFKPSMFKYFTPISISELRNQLIPPADIWGREFNSVTEQMANAKKNYQRAAIIEKFLVKHLRKLNPSPIENAVIEVLSVSGTGKIDNFAQNACLSASRFRKRFKEEVGLSPKEFQRLIRISALSKYYQRNRDVKLTRLAYQFDYFDQSHLIKEFKSVTGFAPHSYLKNKRFLQF